jgi:hypothetical protein
MTSTIAPIRTAGIATGLALAALMVLAFRVPVSSQSLGAGVRMAAVAPGEVHVPSTEAFLKVAGLEPGGTSARATLPERNVTRGPVAVRLRAHSASHDLDEAVHVRLRAGSRTLASTTLGGLHHWTRSLRLQRAQERVVHLRAWIPGGADNTTGRRVAVKLELDAELTGASRR